MKFSIKTILMFCFTAVISIGIIAIILPSYSSSKNIMIKHAFEIMDNISTFAVDKSKTYMISARDATKLTQKLGSNDIVNSENINSMERYFYEQLQINHQFSAIYYGKENGDFLMVLRKENGYMTKIISYNKKGSRKTKLKLYNNNFESQSHQNILDKYDPRVRPWYKLAKQNNGIIWTDPYVFFTLKKPGITTAMSLLDKDNKVKGVIGVDIEISRLSKFISNLKISENSKVFIIDKSLKIVAYPSVQTIEVDKKNSKARLLRIDEINDEIALKSYNASLKKVDINNKVKIDTFSFESNGKIYFAKFVPFEMNNIKWTIGMYVPEDDYLGLLKQDQNNNIVWMILIGIISLFISYFISQAISKPIDRLQNMAHELKNQNFDIKNVEPSIFTEIDETIQSFNKMKESLISSNKDIAQNQKTIIQKNNQLSETKQLLQDIIDNAPIRIFWKDRNSVYLGANKLFIKDHGLNDINDLIGKKDSDFTKIEYFDYMEDDKSVMNNDCPKLNYIESLTDDDGTKQIVNTSKVPLHNYLDEVIGIVGVYDDITEHINTQNELKEKEYLILHQSKLASMGEMIGNIAHQWRQPLSIVSSLVMAMQLKIERGLYEEKYFDDKLSSINDSLQHMSKTIDDFKNFFKPQKDKKIFNLRYIYQKTHDLVGEDFRNKGIEIIQELNDVEVKGFDNELVQVIINIINNSIYAINTKDMNRKLIFISTYKNQDNAFIEVKDNGGGIPLDIIDKIFEPYFTTKHKSQGTGIGLYMSSEIISKHMQGGIVVKNVEYEFENENYTGAKFIITLPLYG